MALDSCPKTRYYVVIKASPQMGWFLNRKYGET